VYSPTGVMALEAIVSVALALDPFEMVNVVGSIEVEIVFETFSVGLDRDKIFAPMVASTFTVGNTSTAREVFEPLVKFRGAFTPLL
jgi:hypothetical protein